MLLNVKIGRRFFKNSFWIASSDLVDTAEKAKDVMEYGENNIGAIVWKSSTLEPISNYTEPRICQYNHGFLVSSDMKNVGIDNTIKEVKEFKKKYPNQSVIISLVATNYETSVEELKKMTYLIKDMEIDGIELNFCYPYYSYDDATTKLLVQNEEIVGLIVKSVKKIIEETEKVLIAKITGWNTDISHISKVIEENGADAIAVSNFFPGIGYYTGLREYSNNFKYKVGEPLLGNLKASYTGLAILPATLLIVNTVRNAVSIPVIATGGCMSSNDAMIQAFFAGASVIESATFYYDENCKKCRNFAKDLIERKNVLERYRILGYFNFL